jgi:hypothetical protein
MCEFSGYFRLFSFLNLLEVPRIALNAQAGVALLEKGHLMAQ